VTLLSSDALTVFVSDDDNDNDEDNNTKTNNKRIFQDAYLTRYCVKDACTWRRGNEGYKL